MWGGRFTEPTDAHLRALNDSLPYDRRMVRQDIAGSIAYAAALVGAGILTEDECARVQDGLRQTLAAFERGEMPDAEDIHTAVELRLVALVGAVGEKLHTGRSRNDQVATDLRLWVMDAISALDAQLAALMTALVDAAEPHAETVMPGYTHMQPAQPITAGHWLLSFFWMLARDRERLADARRRAGVLPLGSGALAGTPLHIDRAALAAALGFHTHSPNSLDAVSDRDFAAEALFALALVGVHLSRLAEDFILYSSPAFGFITLADRYSTGSSLMPQKRNADPMELARGKSGRLVGNLTALLTTLKGLPSSYNKDLQEDKQALFDSFDTLAQILPVVTGIIATLRLNPERMRAALMIEMLATDLAEYLVRQGMPFRQAHHVVGRMVAAGEDFTDLATLRRYSELFADDVAAVFDFGASVAARSTSGGTGAVRQQIAAARRAL